MLAAALPARAGANPDSPARAVERLEDAYVRFDGIRLELGNGRIHRAWRWSGGHLVGERLAAPAAGVDWPLAADGADLVLAEAATPPTGGTFAVRRIPAEATVAEHLEATIETTLGALRTRRTCRVFPRTPAIGCTLELRGALAIDPAGRAHDDRGMIERDAADAAATEAVLERLRLPGRHWRAEATRFAAATDHNDTLVERDSSLLYRQDVRLVGNLLRLAQQPGGAQLFVLKESPAGADQLAWPGHDFAARIGDVRVAGFGLARADVRDDRWTRAYAVVVGVAAPGERAFLESLRAWQDATRRYRPEVDAMLVANTWGDRSRDARMREDFVLRELEAASRLGLTHVQLDDGWQAGLSRNSAEKAGRLWEDWSADSWRPHPERFPRGLTPVVERARELGLQVGLWFNPSSVDDYANWRRDAEIVVDLHRRHGVRLFKIDGIEVPSKRAERNLRRFFDHVRRAAGADLVFNLDVTAGRRPGYHFLREPGNVFLENRYTDWANYYPHRTLRNLWMLSRYVPPQFLQAEFLNLRRNADRYPPDDPYAPARIPFAYAFATTLAAQPLAWFEVSNLDPADFGIAPFVRAWREIAPEFHAGRVFPIGAEPDGGAWTGFQSIAADGRRGFLVVYRETTAPPRGELRTLLRPGARVRLEPVLGASRAARELTVDARGSLAFELPEASSFAVYRYAEH